MLCRVQACLKLIIFVYVRAGLHDHVTSDASFKTILCSAE